MAHRDRQRCFIADRNAFGSAMITTSGLRARHGGYVRSSSRSWSCTVVVYLKYVKEPALVCSRAGGRAESVVGLGQGGEQPPPWDSGR